MNKYITTGIISAGLAMSAASVSAADIAIFGQNNIGQLYGQGNNVVYVSDADLAMAGFLSSFDAFVYTRNGFSFGEGLSAAAAANVNSFVTGNIVIFNGDFQDGIGDSSLDNLFLNALDFALDGNGGGYIGEFRGAFAAYSSNADGNNPIGLIDGSAGPAGAGNGGSSGSVNLTANGANSPIVNGVSFPFNPTAVEFGATLSGENPDKVIARFDNGNAAIIASSRNQISFGAVPEPGTWAMLLLGFFSIGFSMRARKNKVRRTTLSYS